MLLKSAVDSPSNKQIDSRANLTDAGGLVNDLTSTKCCFLMPLTAVITETIKLSVKQENSPKIYTVRHRIILLECYYDCSTN